MPNERLIEADLAGAYRVNRAHVRTAFAMLDQEGLVVRERNRGARVRAISDAEALEIADTRLAIEVMVARQAAARANAADRKALRAIETDMRAAVASEDYSRFSQCNAALHREVQRIAGNATASRILDTLKSHLCGCNTASSCCRDGRKLRWPSIAPSSTRSARATATRRKPRCAGISRASPAC